MLIFAILGIVKIICLNHLCFHKDTVQNKLMFHDHLWYFTEIWAQVQKTNYCFLTFSWLYKCSTALSKEKNTQKCILDILKMFSALIRIQTSNQQKQINMS